MHVKLLTMALAGVLLAGCDYTVPLVEQPAEPIDPTLVGLWQRSSGAGETERLLVLPQGEKEYLVAFPAHTPNAMFARACIWPGEAVRLIQLDWFGTAQGKLPMDERTYQFAAYSLEGDTLRLRLLNPDVVDRKIAASDALVHAIEINAADPDLFREAMVFDRVAD